MCSGPGHQKSWSSGPMVPSLSPVPCLYLTSTLEVSAANLKQYLLCTRHHSHQFTYSNSFHLHSNWVQEEDGQHLHFAQREVQAEKCRPHHSRAHILRFNQLTLQPGAGKSTLTVSSVSIPQCSSTTITIYVSLAHPRYESLLPYLV